MVTRLFARAAGAEGKGFDKMFKVTVKEDMAPVNKEKVKWDISYACIRTNGNCNRSASTA